MKQNLTTEELFEPAQTGQALIRELSNRANAYKRTAAQLNNKDSKKTEERP
jgi:hypothetical protein